MITTTYTCDRCKTTLPNRESLYELKLTASGGAYQYSTGKYYEQSAFQSGLHWCSKCLTESGFFVHKTAVATPPEVPPTLEELIREIVRSELPIK